MKTPNAFVSVLLLSTVAMACDSNTGNSSRDNPEPTNGDTIAISAVQGSGASSPLEGQTVTIVGIVTGDFQDNDSDTSSNLGGFYVQQDTPGSDANASSGIFVFDGDASSTDVKVGDRVEVTASVAEFFGETQLASPVVRVVGSGAIQATNIDLPFAAITTNSNGERIADLERYEGMLLRFEQPLSVTNLRSLERFGEVGLSQGGRLFQFTNGNAPDVAGYIAHDEANARRSITLDDGQRTNNPELVRYLNPTEETDYSIRTGDAVTALTGNLRYARGSGGNGTETWRIMPVEPPTFSSENPRPETPSVGGDLRIASFNVLNFFSTIDNGRPNCGPEGQDNCRGADNQRELSRQLAKTATALRLMDADIVGLVELENNASASIAAIVDAVNTSIGKNDYEFVDTGTLGDDAIKTGFIYRSSSVRPAGSFAILDSGVDPRFNDRRNRPALAQTFAVRATGATLTVVVNHLKSKGSNCDADGDRNRNDGQGNCNGVRSDAAIAMAQWLRSDPTNSDDEDFLVIGDLNAYSKEDPLTAFRNAGFTTLLETDREPYSFVFDGQAGALDHALASSSLAEQVVGAVEWHINADEPPLLDYNLENGRAGNLFDPDTPYRASDHDPIVIGLTLTNRL